METIEDSVVDSKKIRSLIFLVELIDTGAAKSTAFAEPLRQSMLVRIEVEDIGFTFGGTRIEGATGEFAEILAQQVAQLAVEKDFPEGMEPALSAKQIGYLPSEVENRLPNFCVDGNDCWLVHPRQTGGGASVCPVLRGLSMLRAASLD